MLVDRYRRPVWAYLSRAGIEPAAIADLDPFSPVLRVSALALRHDPEVTGVRVALEGGGRGPSALRFAIHALLDVEPAREPVSFDALLQPTTMQYSVSRLRRATAA